MSPTRATSSIWSPRDGVRVPSARWRRRSTGFWPSGWPRPDRPIDDRGIVELTTGDRHIDDPGIVELRVIFRPAAKALVWPQRALYKNAAGGSGIGENPARQASWVRH